MLFFNSHLHVKSIHVSRYNSQMWVKK